MSLGTRRNGDLQALFESQLVSSRSDESLSWRRSMKLPIQSRAVGRAPFKTPHTQIVPGIHASVTTHGSISCANGLSLCQCPNTGLYCCCVSSTACKFDNNVGLCVCDDLADRGGKGRKKR
jgi:hypothetical protein